MSAAALREQPNPRKRQRARGVMDLPTGWNPLDDYDPDVSERAARSPRDTGFPACECGIAGCPDASQG